MASRSTKDVDVSGNDLLQITDKPIVPEEILSRAEGEECGAVVSFIGRVRARSGDKKVLALEHDAPRDKARQMLKDIAGELRQRWDVREVAFCYRTGQVPAGEVTVVIAVATPHRPEAFAACQYAIDRFKQMVSAKEIREDGEFWIEEKT